MVEFRRAQVDTLIQRLSEQPEFVIAVFGPRQTGKTTAVLQAISAMEQEHRYEPMEPSYSRADLLPFQLADKPTPLGARPYALDASIDAPAGSQPDVRHLVEVWQHCRRQAMRSPRGFVLVLDEIQRIAGWSEAVKGLWDVDRRERCPLHVVILGSAPLLMQQGLRESLTGRFEPIHFRHWSFAEMSEAFDFSLDEYIYFGGYPGAAARISDPERWGEYVRSALIEPAIERDVLSMTRVDKPELFKRLFDLGARYSGQQVSYNKLLGHLQEAGNTTTLTRYLGLLTQVGMIAGLPKQTNRPASPKAPTPKLNVLNTALMSAVCGYSFDEARADRSHWGRLTESSVGAHLLNAASPRTEVRYWRDREHEVDFVLQRGPHLVGIEVKSGKAPVVTKGLDEFKNRFQPVDTIVVGDAGVPLHEFLALPPDHWFDSP